MAVIIIPENEKQHGHVLWEPYALDSDVRIYPFPKYSPELKRAKDHVKNFL